MNKKEETLLASALELFAKKGFHGTSTAAIAEHAGVSNGILFHYFRSKDALIQNLFVKLKNEQVLAFSQGLDQQENPKEKIQLIWNQSIAWAISNKEKYYFLQQYKYSPYKRKHKSESEKFRRVFSEIVEKGIQQKLVKYLPDDFIYEVTSASVYGMVEYLSNNPIKYRTPEFMRQAFESFWNSIKA